MRNSFLHSSVLRYVYLPARTCCDDSRISPSTFPPLEIVTTPGEIN